MACRPRRAAGPDPLALLRAKQIVDDLIHRRISHGRASLEMRKLVGRLKGGWLVKALRRL